MFAPEDKSEKVSVTKTNDKKIGTVLMSDATYNFLKWVAMILLPALGTLYFSVSNIWHLPYPEEIVGTIVAIDAFLGVLLGVSTAQYNKARS